DVPTVLRHVDGVRAGATAEVQGFAPGECIGSFDERLQLGWGDARVPGLEAEAVHGPEHDAHLVEREYRAERPGEFGAGDRPRTGYLNLGKVALYQVSYARSAEPRF